MKQREISMILSDCGEDYVDLKILDVDLPEIQEINTEAIAKDKARQGAQLAGGACVVEDTSLEFHALGGMPGPFIKWFQDKLGCGGLHKILADYEDKSASAVCTLAFCVSLPDYACVQALCTDTHNRKHEALSTRRPRHLHGTV